MTDIKLTQALGAYRDAMKTVQSAMSETSVPQPSAPSAITGPSFGDMVGEALQNAKVSGYNGEAMSTKGLVGKADLSDVVTAVSNAELALNTVVAIRDRVINAYQDIIKMPI
jgi:flagellar hook-basal body complex protein FliE